MHDIAALVVYSRSITKCFKQSDYLFYFYRGLILRNRKIKEDKPEPAEPTAVETLKSASESSDNPSSPNSPSTGTSSDADSSEAENS